MKTIEFNTGRLYTAEGQIIKATLYPSGEVTFFDHSRQIDGQFTLGDAEFNARIVQQRYDGGQYTSSKKAWEDGMCEGGPNTR